MLGFDIGGTKCAVSVGFEKDGELTVQNKKVIPTDHTVSAYEMIDRMCELAESMTDDFSCIGISCGGPLDSKRGVILSPPNLPDWNEVHITDILSERFGIPAYLCNDANACALAEWKYGAGVGTKNMIFLTFGTGLGAGLILNSKLYTGATNFAGEIGHVRLDRHGPVGYGKSGSAEGFCSGNGIAQLARTRVMEQLQSGNVTSLAATANEVATITAKDVAMAASRGDALALAVFEEVGEQFGRTLAILTDLLNPELIVAGGVYMRAHQWIDDAMWRTLRREALSGAADALRVLPSQLGEKIGDYAALTVAVNGLKNE
jgi:glucokinase